MDKAMKSRWVKALRSGRYVQGKDRLKTAAGKYCCLGVVNQVCRLGTPSRDPYLDDTALAKLGIFDEEQTALATCNDEGVPFDMIAGLIHDAL